METYEKITFSSRYALVGGLIALTVGSGCNKNKLTMDLEDNLSNERESITHYNVSPGGVALLKKFEGLRKAPYICPGGTLTVGYGQCITSQKAFNTRYPNGFSEKDAHALLCEKLTKVYAPDIKRLVKVPLNQREFDMLVSLNYNIGATILREPTKDVKNIGQEINLLPLLNASRYGEASLELPKFTKGGPEQLYYRGLLKRRMTEMFIFRHSASVPEALRSPIENDNFRRFTKCDSIAKYWEESGQKVLRDDAITLYKAYNEQLEAFSTTK